MSTGNGAKISHTKSFTNVTHFSFGNKNNHHRTSFKLLYSPMHPANNILHLPLTPPNTKIHSWYLSIYCCPPSYFTIFKTLILQSFFFVRKELYIQELLFFFLETKLNYRRNLSSKELISFRILCCLFCKTTHLIGSTSTTTEVFTFPVSSVVSFITDILLSSTHPGEGKWPYSLLISSELGTSI